MCVLYLYYIILNKDFIFKNHLPGQEGPTVTLFIEFKGDLRDIRLGRVKKGDLNNGSALEVGG